MSFISVESSPDDDHELETIHLWVDFMYDRMVSEDTLNTEEMVEKVIEQFNEDKLQIGQLVTFRFRGKILKLVVKAIEPTEANALDDSRRIECGQVTKKTKVTFEVIPGSLLRLTGSALYVPTTTTSLNVPLKSRIFKSLFFRKVNAKKG